MATPVKRTCKTGVDAKAFYAAQGITSEQYEAAVVYRGADFDEANDPKVKKCLDEVRTSFTTLAKGMIASGKPILIESGNAILEVLLKKISADMLGASITNPYHFAHSKLPKLPENVSAVDSKPLEDLGNC